MEARLTKLMNKYESDKGTTSSFRHGFSEIYDSYFSRYINPRILEIGIATGGDIMAINDFYDGDCNIVGLDINSDCGNKINGNINYKFYQVDQGNGEMLDFICNNENNFDIIIDDGSHFWDHQMLTLYKFYKKVTLGGIYILEDIHTSIESLLQWGPDNSGISPLEFILGFNGDCPPLSSEETQELREHIKDVTVFSRDNINNSFEGADFNHKSMTAIITFK